MFNSSLRRAAARTCPCSNGISLRPTPPSSQMTATFSTRSHQRRNSSSKPPIPPNNGSPPIPTTSVKQVGAPRSDKRPGAESRLSKRKVAKGDKTEPTKQKDDNYNEWTRSLPSVPSTQHLNSKDVYTAAFFSTHRPISITGPFPPDTSLEDIEKIFTPRPKSQKHKPQDVIYTISSAVQQIDEHTAEHDQSGQPTTQQGESISANVSQRAEIIKALTQHNNTAKNGADPNQTQHLDGQPQRSVKISIQALARHFRPFHAPPVPTPVEDADLFEPETKTQSGSAQTSSLPSLELPPIEFELLPNFELEAETETQQTSKTTPAQTVQGQKELAKSFFTPSYNSQRRSRRGLLLAKDLQEMLEIRRKGQVKRMQLISVKRQRKLKMKKHKLSKLRRRTRNLKRRQGKI